MTGFRLSNATYCRRRLSLAYEPPSVITGVAFIGTIQRFDAALLVHFHLMRRQPHAAKIFHE